MASPEPTEQPTTRTKKRIGGFFLVQEDEHAITYVLIPWLRWVYFLILLSWAVVIVSKSTIALAIVAVPTIIYFAVVWWPSQRILAQIRAATRGGWVEFKGGPLSLSNPATYRIAKLGQAKSGDA